MSRRTAVLVASALLAAGSTAPALAAKPKPKPKPITGSYTVSTTPDPTYEVLSVAGQGEPGCDHLLPSGGNDDHPFTVPAAGTLKVVLDGQDPTPSQSPLRADWDLYVTDPSGVAGESTGGTAHEEIVLGFKKKTAVTFVACNNNGMPSAKVSYTFTYK
jgi:hypothetical protein